ncbi:transposase-like protein [Sinorhizobium medicae]
MAEPAARLLRRHPGKDRDEGFVRNKAVYIALAVLPDGTKEILGLWSALKNLSTASIKGFPFVLKYWKLREIVGDV